MLFVWFSRASTALTVGTVVLPIAVAVAMIETPTVWTIIQNRFPPLARECVKAPAGILVPGGGLSTYVVAVESGVQPPSPGLRVKTAVELARAYPSAKLVFAGAGEADPTSTIARQGIDPGRIVLEKESSNTYENAVFSARIMRPRRDQQFILVTSADHMPRAVGSYRAAGFDVLPQSVDFRDFKELTRAHVWNEVFGLITYRLTWRTDAFFPAPAREPCAAAR